MAKEDFMPKDKPGYVQWHDTYKSGVTELGTELGATADEITAVGTRNAELHAKRTNTEGKAAAAKQATGEEDAVIKTAQTADRALAKKFKLSPNYTEAKGKRLGIEGANSTTVLTEPTLTGAAKANGRVEVDFPKKKSRGVNLYSKRGTETTLTFLARDTEAPTWTPARCWCPASPSSAPTAPSTSAPATRKWANRAMNSPSRQSHEEKRAIYLAGDTVFGPGSAPVSSIVKE